MALGLPAWTGEGATRLIDRPARPLRLDGTASERPGRVGTASIRRTRADALSDLWVGCRCSAGALGTFAPFWLGQAVASRQGKLVASFLDGYPRGDTAARRPPPPLSKRAPAFITFTDKRRVRA